MLVVNPSKRITAASALNDEWIKNMIPQKKYIGEKEDTSLTRLRSFKVKNQLQKSVLLHIASRLQSERRTKELKEIFQKMDKNGDGMLDKNELVEGYIQAGKEQKKANKVVDQLLRRIDINNNGLIDYSEFLMANLKEEDVASKTKVMESFKVLDKNNNDYIEISEIKEMLGDDEESTAEILKCADSNSDNKISFEEFYDMIIRLYRN
eukprot:TRINITY_DN1470_c0_g1_i7.p1 TRINITY_DN1470_c0_g1~~TRINITY_DN1470_c0_g1_i7.p1  ORF type:complete len:208 (-),score=55.88 TRINITY_DN1470_c0_g1_i7:13-636(-)